MHTRSEAVFEAVQQGLIKLDVGREAGDAVVGPDRIVFRVRDTGPFTATLQDGQWAGSYHGTHAPVVIWYSPETNRAST